jgi:phosphate transport system substrate-binding protein
MTGAGSVGVRSSFTPSEPSRYSGAAEPRDDRSRIGWGTVADRSGDDVARLRTFIREQARNGYRIMFVGHTDNVGSADANRRLLISRARGIANQVLGPHNNAIVLGYGSDYPIASNDTEDGKQLNRRVDVWSRR